MENNLKRMLLALNYPESDSVDVHDFKDLKKIVLWVDENLLHTLNSEDIEIMQQLKSPSWLNIFSKLTTALKCPIDTGPFPQCVAWVVHHALMQSFKTELQTNGKKFENEVKNIGKLLKITDHPDTIVSLKAIEKHVQNNLSVEAIKNFKSGQIKSESNAKILYKLERSEFFEDKSLNKAANALHLLYIENLKKLQIDVNRTITAVQNVTADPKTITTPRSKK